MSTPQGEMMSSLPPVSSPPGRRKRSLWIHCIRFCGFLLLLAVLGVVGLLLYVSSSHFADVVRHKVIVALEDATGGRVELGSLQWSLRHLAVEMDNLTIHGLESQGEKPYTHIDRVYVRARILSFLSPKVILDYVGVDHPAVHLIVYPDGRTNQPVPRHKAKSSKSLIDTVFDLQIQRLEANNGLALINERAIPFSLAANNVGIVVTYAPADDRYLGDVQISDLDLRHGSIRPMRSKFSLQVELGRNAVDVKALHFASGASQLDASGSAINFAKPEWKLSTKGSIDLIELSTLVGIDGLNRGTARLDLVGHGIGLEQFLITGDMQLANAAYEPGFVMVRDVNATGRVGITPEEISITSLNTRLRDGGNVSASVRFTNWNASSPSLPEKRITTSRKGLAPMPRLTAAIRAQVHGVRLPTILETVAIPRYQNLGFDTAVDGPVSVDWTGNGSDLIVAAKVQLSAPVSSAAGELPLSGFVDAQYYERGGKVQVNRLEAHSPASDLNATGVLGVFPVTASSDLDVKLSTRNLGEFDRALRDLGLSDHGKNGVAAIPVRLSGEAEFSGTVGGPLTDPQVTGHLAANNFSTTFRASESGLPSVSAPPEELATAVSPSPSASGRTIHWDHLDAKGEYSSQLISIQHATLIGGGAKVELQGELHGHRISAHSTAFDDNSALTAMARIHEASLGDLLAIAGQSAPISGTVGLDVHVAGTLGDLHGGGNVDIRGGELMGEPYHSVTANVSFAGQSVNLVHLRLLQNGGAAVANGTYDLKTKIFLANLDASNFELAHFHRIQSASFPISGLLKFDAHASGTLESPSVLVGVHLTGLSLRGQPAGSLEAFAHTQDGKALFTAHMVMASAQLELSGQTVLHGDFPTQAKVITSNFDIEPLLKSFNVQNVTGRSLIAGTVNLSGPAKDPRQFNGDVEINQFSATVENIALQSEGPLRASYREGVIHITQAHIMGPDTDLKLTGTAGVMGDRPLNLSASGSINMTLAETLDSDITASGHVDFNVEADGSMSRPALTGQVHLKKVAMSLNDVPTGISNLNGTLVFDQDRLEVQDLAGTTGGGQLTLAGFITYQNGVYGDLTATGKNIRIRYSGLSATADTTLHLQGSRANMLLSGNALITRFIAGPNLDFAAFAGSGSVSPPPNPTAASNHVRLDVHIVSSPQLDFQNSYAQLAGSVDLRIRGTVAQPTVLGRINITEGSANFAGTTYQLQHGDIYFTNPVRIEPVIDIDATTRIEEYDVTVGLHGSSGHLTPTFRSEPPLPQADVISLLALGRTQQEQQIYSQEENQAGSNPTTNALLGGALNATVGSRVQKLFGVGSVKIDPTYLGNLGNSTARITVQQNISRTVQLTYATNVNTTAEQLIQAQVNLTSSISVLAVRDESDVFSIVLKVHKRFR